ncbi:MAG: DUF1579 domain-containing protein [Phycisphaeraceae bacterium]|nr:DUF1579 domain-containing protein [Phycisphaeraceae bacterium]MCW5755079.1 DUF1579 domain-containing protein [Phycisphaeraceae bacterium]
MSTQSSEQASCMQVEPTAEHQWLKQFVGEWTFEAECVTGPDQPPFKSTGREKVRMLGDLWLVFEGESTVPGMGMMRSLMMLGYDPAKKRFVGSWACTVMTHMFVYSGVRDASGAVLPLDTEGPDFADPAKVARYQDVHELRADGRRGFWAQCLGPDGNWVRFMNATYTRVK